MQKSSKNENSQFFCSICSRKLSSLAHFNKHMTTIHKVKDFICDYDGKHFNTKDKLRLHIYQHRKCFNLKCNVCGKDYKTNQSMRKHLRTHFQKHQCQHCGKVFGHKRLLLNHITAIHEELQDVQCKFCTRLFSNTTTRDSHIKLVHKDQTVDTKKFRCTECPAGFEMREELRIHTFIHFNGEIHHCFECNQIFKKRKLLTLHMKMHENPKFNCGNCGTLFKYKSNLHKHLKKGRCVKVEKEEVDAENEAKIAKEQFVNITKNFTKSVVDIDEVERGELKKKRGRKRKIIEESGVTQNQSKIQELRLKSRSLRSSTKTEKNDDFLLVQEDTQEHSNPSQLTRPHRLTKSSDYQCDLCSFKTFKKSQLLSHLRGHISSTRHKCKICLDSFTSIEKLHKHSLKNHKKGVFGSVEYSKSSIECEICQKVFSAERFSSHLNLHQQPKFQCDNCGILFRTKQALERHMRSRHEADRLIACTTCGKKYKKMSLKQHEETHSSVKIYVKCKICLKLMQMKNLKLHIEMKHGDRYKEKNCICECGKAFRYQKQLQKHVEQVHEKINLGRNYRCENCDFLTTRLSELRAHSFEHYSGPIFECLTCRLKFKTKKLLHIHSKTHLEGSREYRCSKCHCVFQTSGGKRKHELKVHVDHFEIV